MNKFQRGIELHQRVIHTDLSGHHGQCDGNERQQPLQDVQGRYDGSCDVCREEQFIKRLSLSTAKLVCSDCFTNR